MCIKTFNNQHQTFNIISTIAYLTGVSHSHFLNEHEPMEPDIYNILSQKTNARVIRCLCILRTLIEQNYSAVNSQMRYEFKHLDNVAPGAIGNCIHDLEDDGITLLTPNLRTDRYIIKINRLIEETINDCKELFPDWVKWEYIRKLFVMPGGNTEQGVKDAGMFYQRNKNMYPYQVYLGYLPNSVPENIFYNDKKFLTMIYSHFNDEFDMFDKVILSGDKAEDVLVKFLYQNEKSAVFIDCENSSPEKALAMLMYLDRQKLSDRISRVILYNDKNTVPLWDELQSFVSMSVINRMTNRVKLHKSLVDIQFSAGLCREHFENAIDSFILLTSDSDYCGLMNELPSAKFLVMTEYTKCSDDMLNAMENLGVSYCSLDEFNGKSSILFTKILTDNVIKKLNDALCSVNIYSEANALSCDTYIDITDEQKRNITEECLKRIKVFVDSSGKTVATLDTDISTKKEASL